jgi:protein-tyrosine phosphatase
MGGEMTVPERVPPIPRSYWVTPHLLAGAYPGATDQEEARGKVAALVAAGVTQFLDLTETRDGLVAYERLVTELVPGGGVVRRAIPVQDLTAPSADVVRRALDLIDEEASRGGVTYVHCWGGIGRTGSIIGCWLAREVGGDAALERLRELRMVSADAGRFSPETSEQRALVRTWPSSSRGPLTE